MSTGVIVILAVVVVLVVVLALGYAVFRMGSAGEAWSPGLRRRFGPEYKRALAQHGGDRKAAEADLRERLRRHRSLRADPLPAGSRMRYEAAWARIQEQFVESPAEAVAEADQLLGRLARDRGFPADEIDTQFEALSVHHPRGLQHYRKLHEAAARPGPAEPGRTERLRQALLAGRGFFKELAGRPAATERRSRPKVPSLAGFRRGSAS